MTVLIGIAFLISWALVLVGPVVAATSVAIRRNHNARSRMRIAASCAGIITLVVVANVVHVETMWKAINFCLLALAYFAYCLLAALSWTIKPLAIRIPVGLAAYVPLLPGYVLGTIGIVALPFFLADYLSPALKTQEVRPGLLCRTTGWGAAFSDEGYIVHLYRYLPVLPVARIEVKRVTVDETNPGGGQKSATCQSVAALLR